MADEQVRNVPAYNNGTLSRGESYACGCVQGVYDCGPVLWCSQNPRHAAKIKAHKRELRSGPRGDELDADAYSARFGDGAPTCCSCHLGAPCSYCLSLTEEEVDAQWDAP